MSLSTDVFQDMARQLPGSPRILSGSRTAAWPNTGMSSRTKPDVNPLRADCRCSAITSLADVPAQGYLPALSVKEISSTPQLSPLVVPRGSNDQCPLAQRL